MLIEYFSIRKNTAAIALGLFLLSHGPCAILAEQGTAPTAGKIEGFVYEDHNQDATFNQGELLRSGIMVRLLAANGKKLAEQRTTALGSFGFAKLEPGIYRLRIAFTNDIIVKSTGIKITRDQGEHFLTFPVLNELSRYNFLELGLVNDSSLDGEEATPFVP